MKSTLHFCYFACAALALALLCHGQSSAASLALTGPLGLSHASNLILNGSFEDHPNGINPFFWATGTSSTPQATPANWTGLGGPNNYARWLDPSNFAAPPLDLSYALYFGNFIVSAISQTPTFHADGSVTFPLPPVIVPTDATYTPPVSLSQTLFGLDTTKTYGLSFWASGEDASGGDWEDGIFGLNVTGFSTVYLTAPGGQSALGSSHVYNFLLNPASSTTTITFTNWGHFSNSTVGWGGNFTTELVLDDVIINVIPEPASLVILAAGLIPMGIVAARRLRRARD